MGDEALAIVATSSDASEAGTGNVPAPSTGTARRCRSCLPRSRRGRAAAVAAAHPDRGRSRPTGRSAAVA